MTNSANRIRGLRAYAQASKGSAQAPLRQVIDNPTLSQVNEGSSSQLLFIAHESSWSLMAEDALEKANSELESLVILSKSAHAFVSAPHLDEEADKVRNELFRKLLKLTQNLSHSGLQEIAGEIRTLLPDQNTKIVAIHIASEALEDTGWLKTEEDYSLFIHELECFQREVASSWRALRCYRSKLSAQLRDYGKSRFGNEVNEELLNSMDERSRQIAAVIERFPERAVRAHGVDKESLAPGVTQPMLKIV